MHYAPHSQSRFFLPPHWVCWLWAMFCNPCTTMPWYWYPPQNQQKNCKKIQQGHMKYCRISSLRRDLRVHENRDFLYQSDWVCRVSDLWEMKGWSLAPFVWAKKCQKKTVTKKLTAERMSCANLFLTLITHQIPKRSLRCVSSKDLPKKEAEPNVQNRETL